VFAAAASDPDADTPAIAVVRPTTKETIRCRFTMGLLILARASSSG
jgi:hypothetical protein